MSALKVGSLSLSGKTAPGMWGQALSGLPYLGFLPVRHSLRSLLSILYLWDLSQNDGLTKFPFSQDGSGDIPWTTYIPFSISWAHWHAFYTAGWV